MSSEFINFSRLHLLVKFFPVVTFCDWLATSILGWEGEINPLLPSLLISLNLQFTVGLIYAMLSGFLMLIGCRHILRKAEQEKPNHILFYIMFVLGLLAWLSSVVLSNLFVGGLLIRSLSLNSLEQMLYLHLAFQGSATILLTSFLVNKIFGRECARKIILVE